MFYLSSDISDSMVSAEMEIQAAGNPPLDILLRTGGVKRLSDFLTWQVRVDFLYISYLAP